MSRVGWGAEGLGGLGAEVADVAEGGLHQLEVPRVLDGGVGRLLPVGLVLSITPVLPAPPVLPVAPILPVLPYVAVVSLLPRVARRRPGEATLAVGSGEARCHGTRAQGGSVGPN